MVNGVDFSKGATALAAFALVFLQITTNYAFAETNCIREEFGSDWREIDKLNTRARVLIERAVGPIEMNDNGNRVVSGTWEDDFTGKIFANVDAQKVQIDHIIPVCWAWDRGAENWSKQQRVQFYNDKRFLQVIDRTANSSKGARGPDKVLPLNQKYACAYAEKFLLGIEMYGINPSPEEWMDLRSSRDTACRLSDIPG